jgi:hypothetical protein
MPRTIIVTETDVSHCFIPALYSRIRSSYLESITDIISPAWSERVDWMASKSFWRIASIISSAIFAECLGASGVRSMIAYPVVTFVKPFSSMDAGISDSDFGNLQTLSFSRSSSCCGMLSQKAFSFSVGSRHGAVQ